MLPPQAGLLCDGESNGWWVALWLETNIAAQERTIKGAWSALRDVVSGQAALDSRRGRSPFEYAEPAPQWYWHAYDQAKPLTLDELDDDAGTIDEQPFDVQPRLLAA